MKSQFSVSLSRIIDEFKLVEVVPAEDPDSILVSTADVNRPGLQFAGYYEYYDNNRIQIIGRSEESFLFGFEENEYQARLKKFFETKPKLVIMARDFEPSDFTKEQAIELPALFSLFICFLLVHNTPN